MLKKFFIVFFLFVIIGNSSYSQNAKPIADKYVYTSIDTSLDIYSLMEEMDEFLDSIYSPRSYLLGNLGVGRSAFNFLQNSESLLQTEKKLTYTPSVSYFHKSGFSMSVTGNMLKNNSKTDMYQFSISPGYDYLKNYDWSAGIAYTKFFTKNSISFYTTPLQNELYTYFTLRKFWLKPSVVLSYGWGNRTDYFEREILIQDLRLRRDGIIKINSTESINDFSVSASVRHDFYWLDIFSEKDYIQFSPQLVFSSGTQSFGFNQSTNIYGTAKRNGANLLYNSENIFLDDQLLFQPLSLTLLLKGEYFFGKIFFQPQLACDYYFPASEKNLNFLFSLNMGVAL